MEEHVKKDVILINKMCTGSYTINNIGHEIINYFKDDKGDNYIYISPYGGFANVYNNRIDKVILTSALSNGKVEILALVEIDDKVIMPKDGEKGNEKIHKKQVEALKDVTYGGKNLEEIFKNNKENEKAIYVTFKVDKMLRPKKGIKIYISNNKKDKDKKYIIYVEKNLPSSSLKGYFIKDEIKKKQESKEYYKDYENIKKFLEKNKNLFETYETYSLKDKVEDFQFDNRNINYLQIIEKVNEEQIYTNLLYYWFSRNNLFDIFINEKFPKFKGQYQLSKEKRIKKGRMDIFAISKEKAIIIENKILSGLNGINSEEESTQLKTYIDAIRKDYKIDSKNVLGLIFVPDYNKEIIEKELNDLEKDYIKKFFNTIPYSEILNFFKENKEKVKYDLYYNNYYDDFLNTLKNHIYSNTEEKNRTEMERKFMFAIKNAKKKI
jgi:hypothetical protein